MRRPLEVAIVLLLQWSVISGLSSSLSTLSQQVWNPRSLPWLSDRRATSLLNRAESPPSTSTTTTQMPLMTQQFLLNDTQTDVQVTPEKINGTIDSNITLTTIPSVEMESKTEIDELERLVSTSSLPNQTSTATTAEYSATPSASTLSSTSFPTTTETTTETTTTTTTTTTAGTTPTPNPTRATTLNPDCHQLTTDELNQKLEKVGGRNQRFMANSPEEAGRNFPGLLPDPEEIHDAVAHPKYFSDALPPRSLDPDLCDDECLNIKSRLNEALLNRDLDKVAIPLNDTGPPEVQEGKEKWKGACYLDKFIALGNCSQRGDEEVWGYEKLCSACHGVYLMSENCFPQFFNSIVCNRHDARCIFDRFTTGAHGKCQARTLSFKVMRNIGTAECQDWVYEYLDVPIACECYLSKNSWLMA
uniref:Uncharacterized protein n=1 Tax=Plectus sambesii TaxID=2011161 RepID=A0A914WB27_9BILA